MSFPIWRLGVVTRTLIIQNTVKTVTPRPPLRLFQRQTCGGFIVRLESVIGIHHVCDTKTYAVYTPEQHLWWKGKWRQALRGVVWRTLSCMSWAMFPRIYYLHSIQPFTTSSWERAAFKQTSFKYQTLPTLSCPSLSEKKTWIWFCILLFWAIQPRGNTNELLFLPTGCSCETYELFLSCWWVMREHKIKDCHIAFSSSQAECCFINSFSTYCFANAEDWTADVATPRAKTSMSFTTEGWSPERCAALFNSCIVSMWLPFRDWYTFALDFS